MKRNVTICFIVLGSNKRTLSVVSIIRYISRSLPVWVSSFIFSIDISNVMSPYKFRNTIGTPTLFLSSLFFSFTRDFPFRILEYMFKSWCGRKNGAIEIWNFLLLYSQRKKKFSWVIVFELSFAVLLWFIFLIPDFLLHSSYLFLKLKEIFTGKRKYLPPVNL